MTPFRCIPALACLALALVPAAPSAASSAESSRQMLYQWTDPIARAIQSSTAAPCLASRNLAIIYAAAYDAANAPQPRYQPYLADLPPPPASVDPQAASLAALAFSAETLFPSQRALFRSLKTEQQDRLRAELGLPLWQRSIAFGEQVATAHIEERADDGSTSTQTYFPKEEPGKWRRTPPRFRPPELSYWSGTRPFVIPSASRFRPPPPPALDSPEYADALEEVRAYGAKRSPIRTAEQTEIAQFWSCFSYTSTPAGHWYEIATRLADREGLAYLESARLLALVNLAMADAGIACWDAKYHYEFWRPIQAIRDADQDGNHLTSPDTDWDSLLEAPPHPEYPSGHGAFSGAGGRLMELYFDAEDGFAFSTTSSSLPGVVRSYQSFDECTDEICLSRLYGGIHFQLSNLRGRDIGEAVANYVFQHCLRPLP